MTLTGTCAIEIHRGWMDGAGGVELSRPYVYNRVYCVDLTLIT